MGRTHSPNSHTKFDAGSISISWCPQERIFAERCRQREADPGAKGEHGSVDPGHEIGGDRAAGSVDLDEWRDLIAMLDMRRGTAHAPAEACNFPAQISSSRLAFSPTSCPTNSHPPR